LSLRRELRHLDLAFIDIETTGTMIGFHEVIDIAVIRTASDARREIGRWHSRLRPSFPERVTDRARELNGFSAQDWEHAPASTSEFWHSVARFVSGCVPVCHNPSFDRSFVTLAARDAGVADLGLDYHWLGTESLAWPLYRLGRIPELSLDALSVYCGGNQEPVPHTGLGGAETCRTVYRALMDLYEE
jgi:DNA polymerase III epsilon subunit-like protein